MKTFDRLADWIAEVWSTGWWFALCAAFVLGWIVGLVARGQWNHDVYHLWLNSPTTALTFLGVFLLHNAQHRFEQATNQRLEAILEVTGVADPVTDRGQK